MRTSTKRKITISVLVLLIALLSFGVKLLIDHSETDREDLPEYSDKLYETLNINVPRFDKENITTESFEYYSELDALGRCGMAYACLGRDLMPTEERGDISHIKPSGWHSVSYDCVPGKSLYNRCHLIGFQLAGENDNEKNLITGTRSMNSEGMLPFENMVADYIKETGNHVMYRVTPIFKGSNLVCDGVQMEALSVEDNGLGIEFNVFVYNEQPGIHIDKKTGESYELKEGETSDKPTTAVNEKPQNYVINLKSKKYHTEDCSSVKDITKNNLKRFYGTPSELKEMGYSPCSVCNKK